jgi:epoxide hydrolase-like predicted phosphatase
MPIFKAVIFDLGGVVFSSPMQAFSKLEQQHGLERNFLNKMIVRNGNESAWSKLERGLLSLDEHFYKSFDDEIAKAGAQNFSSETLMREVNQTMGINQCMIDAIKTLRRGNYKVAALTNNWIESKGREGFGEAIKSHFDVFVESALEGIQKPDPAIYLRTLKRLEVKPEESVFLDDIGRNLKSAQTLGIHTIKVKDPLEAVKELEIILGEKLL